MPVAYSSTPPAKRTWSSYNVSQNASVVGTERECLAMLLEPEWTSRMFIQLMHGRLNHEMCLKLILECSSVSHLCV